MIKTLIIFSSTNGQTRKICSRLQHVIERTQGNGSHEHRVTLIAIDLVNTVDLNAFDKIVIGASIYYGKHSKHVYVFIEEHQQLLSSKANAFFSVNVVARKPEKNQVETNPYLQKFLKETSWQPNKIAIFAGEIEYAKYTFIDRTMIRFIMWMTKGPTDPNAKVEFTNWLHVESFGQTIRDM
ncbi:MAG: menaquinone-dependent protoporphyrinogen IX dehydrogenase [Colwellia sp.]